ncbi:MAG: histone deacetylase, partial [Deltaproteobacteria bacterium]|nr:histone deacetylase [Deltaproteobacteria bacterium]
MKTGIVQDPIYMEHIRGVPHVESPQRLEVLYQMLEDHFSGRLTTVQARPAHLEELAYIHTPDHIKKIASTSGKSFVSLDPDTQTSAKSYEAARMAAGGC